MGRSISWQPPLMHSFNVNCDGAVIEEGKWVGVGAIIRNEGGEMVMAAGHRIMMRLSPLAAEIFAIKLALDLVVERRLSSVMVESDCLEAVRLINAEDDCCASEGVVVDQIRSLMRLIHIPSISFATRESNMAAHSIASFVARGDGRFQWFEAGPSWLMRIIHNDLPSTSVSSRDTRGSLFAPVVGEGAPTACYSFSM